MTAIVILQSGEPGHELHPLFGSKAFTGDCLVSGEPVCGLYQLFGGKDINYLTTV